MAETPRLKEKYTKEIVAKLEKARPTNNEPGSASPEKIVVNAGVGAAAGRFKLLDAAMNDLRIITGQQPCVTRAKKSIAGFHVREASPSAARSRCAALTRMWEFLDRLCDRPPARSRLRGISRASTAVATTRSASPSSLSSRRSITTRSIAPWHGHHVRRRRTTTERLRAARRAGLPVQEQVKQAAASCRRPQRNLRHLGSR